MNAMPTSKRINRPPVPPVNPPGFDKAVDNLIGILTESHDMSHIDAAAQQHGDAMMDRLFEELQAQDAERRALWGDKKFPRVFGAKPPADYVAPATATSPSNTAVEKPGKSSAVKTAKGKSK